ncbi:MAG: pyridoxamine 5'-phosphate oxidase [Pseudomonadota bacterium]
MTENYLSDLLPDPLPDNPLAWAEAWLREAERRADQPNPNAMTVATTSDDGRPSARVVLCKAFVVDPGFVVFYTNYQSRKAQEAFGQQEVAAVFHWDAMGRQVRLEGVAEASPIDESDAYFATRGVASRIGAWGSDQSQPLASRDALLQQIRDRADKLGVALDAKGVPVTGADVPRPPHWGGIRIWPRRVELWADGADRIHDRAAWNRKLNRTDTGFEPGPFQGQRLQP